MAKDMKANNDRHNRLGLSVAEAAFYDAIVQNDAAILQMGDEMLKKISVDLVWAVQQSATIDWSLKESVRASMRSKVRRLLARHGYPPKHERCSAFASAPQNTATRPTHRATLHRKVAREFASSRCRSHHPRSTLRS